MYIGWYIKTWIGSSKTRRSSHLFRWPYQCIFNVHCEETNILKYICKYIIQIWNVYIGIIYRCSLLWYNTRCLRHWSFDRRYSEYSCRCNVFLIIDLIDIDKNISYELLKVFIKLNIMVSIITEASVVFL